VSAGRRQVVRPAARNDVGVESAFVDVLPKYV
jgi:hypothetical protein